VATGLEGPIFEELRTAIGQAPELVFPAFNRRSLKRVMDEVGDGEKADHEPESWERHDAE
jgi:hypothetical protein